MNDSSILPEWARDLYVFDTETTGLAVETTRIVTTNISRIDAEGNIVSSRDWLLDPAIEIPEQASNVHGITTAHAREHGMDAATGIAEIVEALRAAFASGIPVVAYNASYDFSIIDREAKRYSLEPVAVPRPVIDPLVIDREVDRYRKGKRTLEAAAANYGVSLSDAHTAAADAQAAGRVAQAIARKFSDQLRMSAAELHDAQIDWAASQAARFADYLRSVGKQPYSDDGAWPVR